MCITHIKKIEDKDKVLLKKKKKAVGAGSSLSRLEHWLFFQRTLLQFLAPTW
jgi:hypothetical protein